MGSVRGAVSCAERRGAHKRGEAFGASAAEMRYRSGLKEMPGFDDLLGQDAAKTTLERAFSLGKVHHAYRFEGPPGVGKTFAARLLARALVCERAAGCGTCSSCTRAMSLSTEGPEIPGHPDVIMVGRGLYPASLIGSQESTGISVDQIRKIVLPRMGYGPHEGRALVIIILDADELTIAAANSLLKTLEEPPQNTHFILVTSRPKRLIDTIASRTIRVRFGPLPKAALRTLLHTEGLSPDEDLLERAQGSLDRARLLGSEEERRTYAAFVEAVEKAVEARDPSAAVRFAESRPGERDVLLDHLRYLGTSYALRERERAERAPDRLGEFAEDHRIVLRAARAIEQNCSPALALEALILELSDRPR